MLTQEQSVFNLINLSKWIEPTADLASYYGKNTEVVYGIFSAGLDRFMVVDTLDLWSTMYAAKILSSKIQSTVIPIKTKELNINMGNCLTYRLAKTFHFPFTGQTPILRPIVEETDLALVGPPIDFIDRFPQLAREQEFCLFILRACQSSLILQASYSNMDNSFYQRFFPETTNKILVEQDESLLHGGVDAGIEKILYFSNTIDEALTRIREYFARIENFRPFYMQQYKGKFYKLLGIE